VKGCVLKMTRREELHQKWEMRKQEEITAFLNDVNVLHNNINAVTLPSMSIMKECDTYYINYHITKYPNILSYSITRYKKDYPFSIYHTKEFYKYNMPEQYKPIFKELEKYFEQ
jgi:hypothetical protein